MANGTPLAGTWITVPVLDCTPGMRHDNSGYR